MTGHADHAVGSRTLERRPRIALICHDDDALALDGLTRWLASFSDLRGLVIVTEPSERKRRRVLRELRRVGYLRFADVLAYRVLHRIRHSRADQSWTRSMLTTMRSTYPAGHSARVLEVTSAGTQEVRDFLAGLDLDLLLARYKSLLPEKTFVIPRQGTFVMHPGICPEYRNAHGGFWALARRDLSRVGVTLLKIDRGIDTGPVYGYFQVPFDELHESHIVIQERSLFENLDTLQDALMSIHGGVAQPISTEGRQSAEWGQPWLTRYLRWKAVAGREVKR